MATPLQSRALNPSFASLKSLPEPRRHFLHRPRGLKLAPPSPGGSSSSKLSASAGLASLAARTAAAAPAPRAAADAAGEPAKAFHGLCYVVGDNIDTDQIIPAEYLTLVPSNPAEYEKLGSYALIGLPSTYETRFIDPDEMKTKYKIVIGGANFGCGSSREHAPVALGAAGAVAVVAESYARIFFRNSVATGEVYPLETDARICEECRTGDTVTIELAESKLINHTTGKDLSACIEDLSCCT
ncbi:hypothetical protein NL676_033993 [Syzygium grande]|nr:hypothetical protein NL676_033993 [Syzygium grande]